MRRGIILSCEDENLKCQTARSLIKAYRKNCEENEQDIRSAKDFRNGAGATFGLGGLILGAAIAASGPIGWVIGGAALIGAGAGASVAKQNEIDMLRKRCAYWKTLITNQLDVAKANCKDKKCIPTVDLNDYCNE